MTGRKKTVSRNASFFRKTPKGRGVTMNTKKWLVCMASVALVVMGCTGLRSRPVMDKRFAVPGGSIHRGNAILHLTGKPIGVGDLLPAVKLVDAASMREVDLSTLRGKIFLISVVPSIDTRVCEAQTHYLGEEGDRLPASVERITISRDTPFAQMRFAREAKLTDVRYLSDYKQGDFGKATGLLIEELSLLARSVMVVDGTGVVRYLQVVPEMTHLPDMEAAFEFVRQLAG